MRYYPTFYDDNSFSSILERALDDCVAAHGVEGETLDPRPPDETYLLDSAVGVWRLEDAERFAFVKPQPMIDLVGNGTSTPALSEEDRAAAQVSMENLATRISASDSLHQTQKYKDAEKACQDDPAFTTWRNRMNQMAQFSGPWSEPFSAARATALADAEAQAARANYVQCLESNGLAAEVPESTDPNSFWSVQGQSGDTIDEQQITMAITVAGCKTSTGALETVMNVWASYEAPVYDKYADELQANRVLVEQWEAEAQEFWAAHGE
ncbi:MAG: hypothetical protein HGA51_09000 [Demequinaceae bacterium]|nr:hypothetical protein [Demequinaceae bacterium]